MTDPTITWHEAASEYTVDKIAGTEGLGQPYSFVVDFHCSTGLTNPQIRTLCEKPCTLTLKNDSVIHGVFRSFRQKFTNDGGSGSNSGSGNSVSKSYYYQVEVVPSLARMQNSRRTRVFHTGTDTFSTSLEAVAYLMLSEWGHTVTGTKPNVIFAERADSKFTREFIIQYDESDYAFLQRSFAKEGFFYWFSHDANATGDDCRETLHVEHSNPPASRSAIRPLYFETDNTAHAGRILSSFEVCEANAPKEVAVLEFDHNAAGSLNGSVKTIAENFHGSSVGSTVSRPEWTGTVCHFRTVDLGATTTTQVASDKAKLTQHYAEAYAAKTQTFEGTTNDLGVRAGSVLTIDKFDTHFPTAAIGSSKKLLVIKADTTFERGTSISTATARVTFTAICHEQPFRLDPSPSKKIEGLVHAKVYRVPVATTAHAPAADAPPDDGYRYKVQLLCDTGGQYAADGGPQNAEARNGRAPIPARLAQPSSGSGFGMHVPPQTGTEVLLGFMHGDPDRPVMVGTAPNSETPSVVTKHASQQSIWSTPGKIRLELSDHESH